MSPFVTSTSRIQQNPNSDCYRFALNIPRLTRPPTPADSWPSLHVQPSPIETVLVCYPLPVNFKAQALRIHTGSVPSPAKIDGSDFCIGGIACICAGLTEPFQGSHGRRPTSRRTSSVHLGDQFSRGIWSLQKAQLNLQKAAFIVKPHRTSRNLRFVFTTSSLPPCQRRTSHYTTDADVNQLSQFRLRNIGLRLYIHAETSLSTG
jgi:hypothetical protein